MSESTQWTDEQVLEALQGGVAADAEPEQAPAAPAPVGETQNTQTAEVQPVEPVATAEQNTDLFEGTAINPDELIQQHPELAPLVKQLQGVFTQKTQSVADQRKQIEALGDLDAVQQAVELTNRINDPANWVQLHSELTAAMQQYGMTPAEASAAAAEAMNGAAAVESPAAEALSLDEIEDPELAPLAQMLKSQQAEIDALKQARETERVEAQREYETQAFLGELQRQENAIRASHPDWDDEKILSVYQMSSFFGGNLSAAAERLESLLANERALYLSQKEGVAAATGSQVPPKGAGVQSEQISGPQTIREAEDEAIEFFKARAAAYAEG